MNKNPFACLIFFLLITISVGAQTRPHVSDILGDWPTNRISGDWSWSRIKDFYGVVNVKDYGAVGDYDPITATGTDNHTAFVNALASATTKGVALYIPGGNYYLSEQLTIADTSVFGDGKSTVLYKGHNTLNDAFIVASGAVIANLSINGNKNNITNYETNDPTLGSALVPTQSIIDCVTINNTESSCIAGSTRENVVVTKCHFSGWDDHAFYFSTRSRNITLRDSFLGKRTSGTSTIQFRDGCYNCLVDNVDTDFMVTTSAPFLIANTTAATADTSDITIQNCNMVTDSRLYIYNASSTAYINNIIIRNNSFYGNGTQPLWQAGHANETNIRNLIFENNVCDNFSTLWIRGNASYPNLSNIRFINNTLRLQGYVMIGVVDNFVFSDNTVVIASDTAGKALYIVTPPTTGWVTNNTFILPSPLVSGITLGQAALQSSKSIIYMTKNQFIGSSSAILSSEAPSSPTAPRGLLIYHDNYEYAPASDTVNAGFKPFINIDNRYRQAIGTSTAVVTTFVE